MKEIEIRKDTPKTIRRNRNPLNLFLCFCAEKTGADEAENLTLAAARRFTAFMITKSRKGSRINGLWKAANQESIGFG